MHPRNSMNLIFILITISCTQVTFASEALTLEKALEIALASNPELAAVGHAYDAAHARPPQAATPPDPQFMVDFMGVPTNTANVDQGTIQYMVEQEIPFPSKLVYGYKAEKHAAEAAFSQKNATEQEITKQVKQAYLDLWRIQEEEKIERETLAIYRQNKASSEEAYAALKGPIADSVRALVDMGEIEGRLAILGQDRIVAAADLAKLMARDIEPGIQLATPPPSPPIATLSELITKTKETRPEISEAQSVVASENARLSVAKSQYAPDFMLRWGFMDNPSGMPNAWYGRAGISVPLWSLSKQRFGVRESKAMLARARSIEETIKLSTESDVKSAHARFVAAKRIVDIYSNSVVPRARMLVRSSQESYQSDKGDFLNIVDAIRSLNDAQLMLVRAKADAGKAYADLERAVGTPPTQDGH